MMKAIRVTRTGGPEVLLVSDLPVPHPESTEVIVKVAASGVNYIDVYYRDGRYAAPLPFVIGLEGAGTVHAVGADVHQIRPGDRVAWTHLRGSYAEYAAIPADRAVRIPAGVSDQQAAAAMLQGLTAHVLTHDTYPLKRGDTALVHAAAGGVGLLLVQMARYLGAHVIATVSTPEKAQLAREAGAEEIILYTHDDFEREVKRLTDGRGVHVVYDSVGKTTFEKGLNVLQRRGMMVLYGASSGAVPPVDLRILLEKGSLYVTSPSLGQHIATRDELESRSGVVFSMVTSGSLSLRIGQTYPLADAAQAHRDLEARKTTGKILLLP